MAFIVPTPVTSASSEALTFSSTGRIADPFTESNVTWNELISSTSEDWGGFYFYVQARYEGIVQLAVGAASSETRIAILPTRNVLYAGDIVYYVPIPITSGTRISVSYQQYNAGRSIYCQILGIPSSNFTTVPSFTTLDAGPFILDTADTAWGTVSFIDPGGTANTKTSYIELSESGTNSGNNVLNGDSLSYSYDYLGLSATGKSQNATGAHWLYDVAYGAASSETNFISDAYLRGYPYGTTFSHHFIPYGRASGDRISARVQSDHTTVNEREVAFMLLGLR